MKNNIGQVGLWVAIVGVLAVVFVAGYYFMGNSTATGNVVSNGDNCRQIDVSASYLVVGDSSCEGNSGSSASCTVKLQNKESVPITAQPVFNCNGNTLSAEKKSLSPEQTGEFMVSFNNGGSAWTCTMSNAKTMKTAEVCD